MALITTVEAASRLGVSRIRIFQFIKDGRLPSQKIGRDVLIDEDDLDKIVIQKRGRPPKVKGKDDK